MEWFSAIKRYEALMHTTIWMNLKKHFLMKVNIYSRHTLSKVGLE